MEIYIYAADCWCEDCGQRIRDLQTAEGAAPEAPDDETSYDSDEFPKGPYSDGGGESDTPQHCAAGKDCLNAITLPSGDKIGAWLENELTSDGVQYVIDTINGNPGEVTALWAEWYGDLFHTHTCPHCNSIFAS